MGGGSASFRVARWNGTSWSSVGSGTNSMVSALAVLNSELISGSGNISILKNAAITDVTSYSAVVNDVNEPVVLYSIRSGVVRTKKLASSSGNWTAASTVQSGTSGRTVLSSVSGLNRLVGFWLRGGNIEYKKFNGASWDSTPTVLFESSTGARFASCDETSGGGLIKCMATLNTLPPFDVTTRRVINP